MTTDAADTFVDGVAARVPDDTAIATIVAGAARIVVVDEDAATLSEVLAGHAPGA